jgi:hypothetical protein
MFDGGMTIGEIATVMREPYAVVADMIRHDYQNRVIPSGAEDYQWMRKWERREVTKLKQYGFNAAQIQYRLKLSRREVSLHLRRAPYSAF